MTRLQRTCLLICLIPHVLFAEAGRLSPAVERAASYLLEQVADPDEIWILPPRRTRRRVGTEQVEVRYREVEVEVPMYEMIEREVLTRRRGDSSSDVGGLQSRTIRVRGEQIGTQTVTRLRRDPEGPIRRTENRVIWGDGGPDEWMSGLLGSNALAATALLRSEHPEAREAVSPMLEFFRETFERHGLPDQTWDLAWLIILFAEAEDPSLHEMTANMVGKLMLSQVRSGPAAGLWGPMAVSPEHLAALWRRYYDASSTYNDLVARFGESPTRRADAQRVAEAATAMRRAQEAIDDYTWTYRQIQPHRTWIDLEDDFGDEILLRVQQAQEYVVNQQTADMESTWLALYALRTARERNLIPRQLPAPPTPEPTARRSAMPPPPPSPREMLFQTAQTLRFAAHPSGAFPEINHHQPVTAFDEMKGLPGVPIGDAEFPRLPSPGTLTSTAQGYSALVQLGRIMGMGALRQQAQAMVRAKQALDERIDAVIEGDHELVGGSGLGILNLYLAFLDPGPEIAAAPRNLRAKAAEHLIRLQRDDGSIRPLPEQDFLAPTVWRQRIDKLERIPRAWTQFDYAQPFTNFPDGDRSQDRSRYFSRYTRVQPVLTTAAALLVLAEERRGTEVVDETEE
ncbi:MAG: hypothetical protein JJU29_07225 [Verrucomicrobia bacterium]|nr:hypothetical protein [Verrucomicrobiota bacterium]MCH8510809.1 hypothetical protein [Kiritimatiellia bacterium]